MYFCNYLLSSQNAIPKNSSTSVEFLAAFVPDRRTSTASVYNQKNSFHRPCSRRRLSPDWVKEWRSATV